MADPNPGSDAGKKQALQNFEAFLLAFDNCSKNLQESTEAIRELTAAIWDEKDGLVAAIDDQIGMLEAHAKEMSLLRSAIAGTKIDVDLGSLIPGVRRRK